MLGLMVDGPKRFKVSTACGSSWHHRCMGKAFGSEQRPERKWFLKVCMLHSAAFAWCTYGGTF